LAGASRKQIESKHQRNINPREGHQRSHQTYA